MSHVSFFLFISAAHEKSPGIRQVYSVLLTGSSFPTPCTHAGLLLQSRLNHELGIIQNLVLSSPLPRSQEEMNVRDWYKGAEKNLINFCS